MNVRDIMTKNPATCQPGTGLEEVARKMVDSDCGMIPVVDEDGRPQGVVTDRDIVCRAVAEGRNPVVLHARDVMTTPCVTCSPDTDAEACASQLEEHKIRRVVVTDEDGRVCGVVAQADFARDASAEKAAEIVREVSQPTPGTAYAH
jgi:CBS domain-containing protein